MHIQVEEHPLLSVRALVAMFPAPLAQLPSQADVTAWLSRDADVPLMRAESLRPAIRDLLRHGGYKPTGRGKPASEYLAKAAEEGRLWPINAAVDVCNAISLHSGFPISVVDISRLHPPLRIGVAPAGSRYVFNASGQEIDVSGLLCLFDAEGPCANAVKDSQRTKTWEGTTETLFLVWGHHSHTNALAAAVIHMVELLATYDAQAIEATPPHAGCYAPPCSVAPPPGEPLP